MSEIALPHLRGAEAPTFLAGLGVLSLVTEELGDTSAALGWSQGPRGPAHLVTGLFHDIGEVAEALRGIAIQMKEGDELLPNAGPGFPPRKVGKSADPTRSIHFDEASGWAAVEKAQPTRSWIPGFVATNDVVKKKEGTGRAARWVRTSDVGRNPLFDAGPGTVSASGTLEQGRESAVDGGALLQALSVGRRRGGSIGGYLDWRADRDAADSASRRDPSTFGDQVIAWLALMGIRIAPLVAVNGVVGSSLCPPTRERRFRKPLVWPVWRQPLNLDAVTALLGHPELELGRLANGRANDPRIEALGVMAVFVSSRISKGNNDGAYGAPEAVWRTSTPIPSV